jgi:hypothetical protein
MDQHTDMFYEIGKHSDYQTRNKLRELSQQSAVIGRRNDFRETLHQDYLSVKNIVRNKLIDKLKETLDLERNRVDIYFVDLYTRESVSIVCDDNNSQIPYVEYRMLMQFRDRPHLPAVPANFENLLRQTFVVIQFKKYGVSDLNDKWLELYRFWLSLAYNAHDRTYARLFIYDLRINFEDIVEKYTQIELNKPLDS